MARVSAIRRAIATVLGALDVSAYRHGTAGLGIDHTLTGDLLDHGTNRSHLVCKVEPRKTSNLERGTAGSTSSTPIEVQVLFDLRQSIGNSLGRESEIDMARDLAEDIAAAMAGMDDTSGDWTIAWVEHQVQGPDQAGQFVAIRVDIIATHQLGA